LLVLWGATLWEGFGFLAVITGAIGIVLAILPLWRILYPSVERRTVSRSPEPGWLRKTLFIVALAIALFLVPLLLLSALS